MTSKRDQQHDQCCGEALTQHLVGIQTSARDDVVGVGSQQTSVWRGHLIKMMITSFFVCFLIEGERRENDDHI